MPAGLSLPVELGERLDQLLIALERKVEAQCVLLADISGQLISVQGRVGAIDPVLVSALAAGDVSAMAELSRQIGEPDVQDSAFLHEGTEKSLYIFVVESFILIVVFGSRTPPGLVRLFGSRAVEELRPLVAEFEDCMEDTSALPDAAFGEQFSDELEKMFEGL
jgi:predicted regulator of Ras-like GTPase activity (Roadblock/LC7/MglB family)